MYKRQAKNSFNNISEKFQLYRGESRKPLYITCVGFDLDKAINAVKQMHGKFRLPDLLKKADRECRALEQ